MNSNKNSQVIETAIQEKIEGARVNALSLLILAAQAGNSEGIEKVLAIMKQIPNDVGKK
jgi:hypothetical protein